MDGALFALINGLAGRSHLVDTVMVALAKYSILLFGLYLILLWFVPGAAGDRRRRRLLVLQALVATAVSLGISAIIGMISARPRPFVVRASAHQLITHAPDASFPSDHGTLEAALSLSLRRAGPLALPVLGGITLLTMLARVFVGVHYPGDMLGALLVALAGKALVDFIWPWLEPAARWLIGLWESTAQRIGIEHQEPTEHQL